MKNVLFGRLCALFLGLALVAIIGGGVASAAPYGKTTPSVGVLNTSPCTAPNAIPASCADPVTSTTTTPAVPVADVGSLAFTGAAVVGLAGLAAAALVAGLTLIMLGRRRA